jgi:hypothetical protein
MEDEGSNGWDTDYDDDFMLEEQEELILDEMYDFEETFDLKEKENGKYYLGMYMNIEDVQVMSSGFLIGNNNHPLFFGNAISTELFFKYKYSHVIKYMRSIIMCRNMNPVVDIMKLIISEDGLYLALIKTHWICLIQRHWRKIMNKKREYMEYQKSFQYIQERELGKIKRKPIFSLHGMLSRYSKNPETHMYFP